MDLLGGYHSSSSDDGGDGGGGGVEKSSAAVEGRNNKQKQQQKPATVVTMRRPPPGGLNAAPTPSVPIAVLRSRGVVGAPPPSSSSSSALAVVTNNHDGAQSGGNNDARGIQRYSTSYGPVQGPSSLSDPADRNDAFRRAVNSKTGSTAVAAADAAIDEFSFSRNRNAFQRGGGGEEAALAPGDVSREIVRNDRGWERRFRGNVVTSATATTATEAATAAGDGEGREGGPVVPASVTELERAAGRKRATIDPAYDPDNQRKSRRARIKHARDAEGPLVRGPDDELVHGVWAPPSNVERALADDALTAIESGVELHPRIVRERAHLAERDRQRGALRDDDNEKEKFDRMVERKMSHLLPPRLTEDQEAIEPSTTFHGDEEVDYRGRSWTSPPSGVRGAEPNDVDDHPCFVPKKCVARLTGHEKGVHRIRLFPRTGHLLLSAGLDGACKVWSVEGRSCLRTYVGHSAAVRDVQFNNDGTRFVSASFDRYLRLWDVESGEVLGTYTNRRVPYVVKFYPHDDNIFVAGCSDNKIVAYDSTTGEITQEYDHHLAAVNTITFVEDNGTKMVTSSDDKKVLVWEWDIGVPIKYISDPTMHSMPVMTMHPSLKFMLGQSLDNKILVYQAGDRYALQRKKKMEGHNTAGYACDVAVSPDGRFVCSGDSNGKLFFWDFKRTRILQKYNAHDKGPAIAAVWHPVEPSTVFTCGWDGVIKVWQ